MPNDVSYSSQFLCNQYLNVDVCFKSPEIKNNGAGETIADNWLDLLVEICLKKLHLDKPDKSEEKATFLKNWHKHTGTAATYAMKHLLLESLRSVYTLINQSTDSAFQLSVVAKLNEELNACTPGFHARVNEIISHTGMDSIDGLLANLRQSLVTRASVGMTDEVHARNRFFTMANGMGLGVLPINQHDVYVGAIRDDVIQAQLIKTFLTYYQPLSILKQCIDMMQGHLRNIGYIGRQDTGTSYDYVVESKIFAYLENIVRDNRDDIWAEDRQNFRIVEAAAADDDVINPLIDVNWPKVTVRLMHIMCDKGYFTFSEEIKRALEFLLVEYHYGSQLLRSPRSEDILALSDEVKTFFQAEYMRHYSELLTKQLIPSTTCFLDLLTLLGDVDVSLKCSLMKKYVDFQPEEKQKEIWRAILEKESYDSELFKHSTVKDVLRKDYLGALQGENSSFSDSLLAGVVRYPSERTKLFIYLQLFDQLTPERQYALLHFTDHFGYNSLMLAARYQPRVVAPLIRVIKQLDREAQVSILCHHGRDKYNALMLAARYQSDAVKPLLTIMQDLNILNDCFFEVDSDYYTIFMFAIRYQAAAVAPLLDVIQNMDLRSQWNIFMAVNSEEYNAVMLAIRCQPSVLKDIVEALKHLSCQLMSAQDKRQIWLHSYNRLQQNIVMLAVIHQPSVMPLLLDAITGYPDLEVKNKLLLDVDASQRTVFQLAVDSHNADTIMALIRFIATIPVENRRDVFPSYDSLRSICKNSTKSQEVLKSEAFLETEMLFQLMRLEAKVYDFAKQRKKSKKQTEDHQQARNLYETLRDSYDCYIASKKDRAAKAVFYQAWSQEIKVYREHVSHDDNIKNILANISLCVTVIGLLILSVSYVYNNCYRGDPNYSFFRPLIKTDIESALDVVAPIVQSKSILEQPTEPTEPTEPKV